MMIKCQHLLFNAQKHCPNLSGVSEITIAHTTYFLWDLTFFLQNFWKQQQTQDDVLSYNIKISFTFRWFYLVVYPEHDHYDG